MGSLGIALLIQAILLITPIYICIGWLIMSFVYRILVSYPSVDGGSLSIKKSLIIHFIAIVKTMFFGYVIGGFFIIQSIVYGGFHIAYLSNLNGGLFHGFAYYRFLRYLAEDFGWLLFASVIMSIIISSVLYFHLIQKASTMPYLARKRVTKVSLIMAVLFGGASIGYYIIIFLPYIWTS